MEIGIPRDAHGLVFLLRDNGNVVQGRALAFALRSHGFGTAVCHLLTDDERARAAAHHRVPVCAASLARRLMTAVDVVCDEKDLGGMPAGIVTSGTASAASLYVAALRPLAFDAIACRRARIGSESSLEYICAPTLFLAAAGDFTCIRPMARAFQKLHCAKHFELVPAGSPSFEDGRSFDAACDLTVTWMRRHLGHAPSSYANAPAAPASLVLVPPAM